MHAEMRFYNYLHTLWQYRGKSRSNCPPLNIVCIKVPFRPFPRGVQASKFQAQSFAQPPDWYRVIVAIPP